MPTTEQITLIKQSWNTFRHVDPLLVGEVFYSRLFTEHPALRALFREPLDEQYCRLVEMISITVARFEQSDEIQTLMVALGERHRRYGVKPEHYALVGEALIWTLKTGLSGSWNLEMEQAWRAFYKTLVDTLLRVR